MDFIRSIDEKFEQYDDSGKLLKSRNGRCGADGQRLGLRLLMIS